MVVVHREAGMRFVIFKDDHEPAHVHAYYNGAEVKIALGIDGSPPKEIRSYGMRSADIRKALRVAMALQAKLLKRWEEIHGRG